MIRVRRARRAALAVTIGAWVLAFAIPGFWLGAAGVAVLGVVAWIVLERRWSWASGLWLIGAALLSVSATVLGRSAWLPLVAQLAALATWDLDRFEQRASQAAAQGIEEISQRHLRRLGIAMALGGSLAGISLLIRTPLGFWPTLLAAVAFVLLLIGALRRATT